MRGGSIIRVTRHDRTGIWKICDGESTTRTARSALIVPGVMGQTGMESAGDRARGRPSETKPDLVIAVDALAARNSTQTEPDDSDRRYRDPSRKSSRESSETGLTRETLGVPVIGIGVPTVVDAATIVSDTMENLDSGAPKRPRFIKRRRSAGVQNV